MLKLSKICEERKGQALVEAAIVMPILIVLMIGILQLGILGQSREISYMASRQGARQMTSRGRVDTAHIKDFFLGPDNEPQEFRDPQKASVRVRGRKSDVTVEMEYRVPAMPWMPPFMPGLSTPLDEPFHGSRITQVKCRMIGDVWDWY